mmetsp:Transcript_38591/g.111492  ORF Transcript_38591/g.111492 Transcript_38591/m.111492 type:complete len:230 (-) Transcript_38591:480-1169(-)
MPEGNLSRLPGEAPASWALGEPLAELPLGPWPPPPRVQSAAAGGLPPPARTGGPSCAGTGEARQAAAGRAASWLPGLAQPAPAGAPHCIGERLEVPLGPLGDTFSMTETGDEGGGLAYFGGSASTSKALKSCRARLLATASLRKLLQSRRCSQVSMCTVDSSASGTSSSRSRSAASTTSPRQRRGTPAKPRLAAASPPPPPPRLWAPEPEEATQKGSLAVQRLGTVMLV